MSQPKEELKNGGFDKDNPVPLRKNPYPKWNLFGMIFYTFLEPFMFRGYRNPLEWKDLFDLREAEKAVQVEPLFSKNWEEEKLKPNPSVVSAMHKTWRLRFWFGGFLGLIGTGCQLSAPIILQQLLTSLAPIPPPFPDTRDPNMKWLWACLLFTFNVLQGLFLNLSADFTITCGMRAKTALTVEIYKKSLRLSNAARQRTKNGEILNLMSIDAQKILDLSQFVHQSWLSVISIVVALALLFSLLGLPTFTGLGLIFIMLPIQGSIGGAWAKLRGKVLKFTDERVKIINEILQGVRVIKYYAWENSFLKQVMAVRDNEMKMHRKIASVRSFMTSLMLTTPVIISVATFIVYAVVNPTMDVPIIFTALAYFNILRFPLTIMPLVISMLVDCGVSIKRIQKLLVEEETGDMYAGNDHEFPVKVTNANFQWPASAEEPEPEPAGRGRRGKRRANRKGKSKDKNAELATVVVDSKPKDDVGKLHDINFQVRRGDLCCVVGAVGSGKSSLLSSMLGEMDKLSGEVEITGKLAYCPQQAWIMNATLKNNILFGAEYDEQKYRETLRVCCLERDITILPGGDQTEIGEKGINLSGGQRQRVNIARAVYYDPDVIFLDDPLSAVDAHVGRAIFDECINGALKGKTRILVTHQLQYLVYADQILFVKDGRISESGTYDELVQAGGEFATLLKTHLAEEDTAPEAESAPKRANPEYILSPAHSVVDLPEQKAESSNEQPAVADVAAGAAEKKTEKGSLMSMEERNKGSVPLRVYWAFIKHAGGILMLILILLFHVLPQGFTAVNTWWLSAWTGDYYPVLGLGGYLGIYAGTAVCAGIFQYIRDVTFSFAMLRAASKFHNSAFQRILRAPMSFFDTTPIGRIISRFSKDQDSLDGMLIMTTMQFTGTLAAVVSTAAVIGSVTPWFLIAFAGLAVVFIFIAQYYRRTARELKRLDSLVRTPLYAHFGETLSGLSTIRAYQAQDRFKDLNRRYTDFTMISFYPINVTQRWLAARLEVISALIVFAAAVFAILQANIDPSLAGLSLTYALQITGVLTFCVRQAAETEALFNSVERIDFYSREVPNERPAVIQDNAPAADWPTTGDVKFEDFVMRYREDLDPVLRGINLDIKDKEKIGIVGRTGAGKSSLMIALFRMVEAASGRIIIDGRDISEIGLDQLRNKLAIIPQEPVLFSGTVRSNLDPFNQYTDEQVWEVLGRAHLKSAIDKLPSALNSEVAEGGDNFSVGQRQLMCLARAMLRRARVLVLDEATASVDVETDALIQATIRREFSDSTMLIIAHRLNTIIDCSRILVMDKGQAAEFDTPRNLVNKPDSVLNGMLDETGPSNAAMLRNIALQAVEPLSAAESLINLLVSSAHEAESAASTSTRADATADSAALDLTNIAVQTSQAVPEVTTPTVEPTAAADPEPAASADPEPEPEPAAAAEPADVAEREPEPAAAAEPAAAELDATETVAAAEPVSTTEPDVTEPVATESAEEAQQSNGANDS